MKVPGNFSNNKDSTLKSESSYKAGDLTNVAYDKMDDNKRCEFMTVDRILEEKE